MLFPWITLFTGFEFVANLLMLDLTIRIPTKINISERISRALMGYLWRKLSRKDCLSVDQYRIHSCELHPFYCIVSSSWICGFEYIYLRYDCQHQDMLKHGGLLLFSNYRHFIEDYEWPWTLNLRVMFWWYFLM